MKLFEKNDRGQLEPGRLWNRMNAEDQASVTTLAKNVEPYYSSMSGAPFFPEYTLHGIEHVRNVISFANKLIPNPTPDSLTSGEIAYLFSAIMIHDLGMFLTEDGFKSLVEGAYSDNQIPGLDSASWNSEWNSYIERVRRYPDTKLINLLGDNTPVESVCLDPDRMQKRDRLVCGDFLRIYHGRLAHQIAIKKFMGTRDVDIFCNTSFDDEDRDLIGLIARSHCVNMRDTESYLNSLFGAVERPKNVRIFYLMSLLRIADYIDAGRNRAPEALTYRQEITSPISRNEWEWNNLIDEDSYVWDSSRMRLNIDASPSTTSQFVMVEKWLNSIQNELDMSWAFLHEKYPEDCPSLSIHRITSRLLQDECRETFKKKFVINDMRLHVNPSILRLLIAPLYGNNPSFGVRELLQNAVDACREREYLKQDDKYKGRVTVSIDTNDKTLTITDNGIGMTEDVLRDYFLSIGSSYRESDEWKQNYTVNRKSEVARTGKFGIGVLSAFLLGNAVNVTTRSIDDALGYQFDFAMETSCINMKRVRADIGTTIKIQLNSTSLEQFSERMDGGPLGESDLRYIVLSYLSWYEWYYFTNPLVEYYIDDTQINNIENRPTVPDQIEYDSWHSLETDEYQSYFWSFSFQNERLCFRKRFTNIIDFPVLFCNGIPLDAGYRNCVKDIEPFDFPAISIVDTEGHLSCNLSRSELQDLPYSESLKQNIMRYILTQLLSLKINSWVDLFSCPHGLYKSYMRQQVQLIDREFPLASFYLLSKRGFIPSIESLFSLSEIRELVRIGFDRSEASCSNMHDIKQCTDEIIGYIDSYSSTYLLPFSPCETEGPYISHQLINCLLDGFLLSYNTCNDAFIAIRVPTSSLDSLPMNFENHLPHGCYTSFRTSDDVSYCIITTSNIKALAFPNLLLSVISKLHIKPSFICRLPLESWDARMQTIDSAELARFTRAFLGSDVWIPFDPIERRAKFSQAFSDLGLIVE